MRALLPFLLLAVNAAGVCAQEFGAQTGNVLTVYDHFGNAVNVSNRFDGSNYSVSVTQLGRGQSVNWSQSHNDGNQEIANAVVLDDNGNVYVAGMRSFQGHQYMWGLKFSAGGALLWERADLYPGCTAMSVAASVSGEAWLAGSCIGDNAYPVRLLHFDSYGNANWGQVFDGGGRNYVRNMSLDYAGRAAICVEVDYPGGGTAARTAVYGRDGGQVTVY